MSTEHSTDPFVTHGRAKCSACGRETNVHLSSSMKLKAGDPVYRDPENILFGRCPKCMRYKLVVTFAPTFTQEPTATGFWKLPIDSSDSSDTEIELSDVLRE